jgi:hypothetical protein
MMTTRSNDEWTWFADDEDAKKQAKPLVDGHAIELWQTARKIAKFPRKD